MMFEKHIFILCAFVSKIIASLITGQPWHLERHQNHDQHIMKPLMEFINPLPEYPLIQTPVITSKKIDIPIEQGVKPIYWSTLLPAQSETLSIPESSLRIEQSDSNVLNYAIPNLTPNNINYYITYPSNSNDGISVAVTANDRAGKNSKTTVDKFKKVNSEYTSLGASHKELKTQTDCNRNIEKSKKILSGEVVTDKNKSFAPINYNQQAISNTINNRPSTDNKIVSSSHKNIKAVKSTEACCQCCRLKSSNPESKCQSDMIAGNRIEEKITSFDQSNTDDALNINLEYADHDCQCIRNSRNNGNTKNARQNEYNMPNDFPIDYLNWIYNLIPNQQLQSYFQDINNYFPYNLEALYKLQQSQSKKEDRGSKNKQTKSAEKSSNRRRTKKKSSKKRNDKKKHIDNCNKVVELSPTMMEVEILNDFVPIDTITAKYTSNISNDILFHKVPELSPITNVFEINPKIIEINPIIAENIPKIIETIPKIIETNPEIIDILPIIIEENRELITATPQIIDINPKIIEINPTNNEIKCGEIEKCTEMTNESIHLNNQNDIARVLYENDDSRREEFLIPLLSDDDFFWDYYPDFTADNGAYITSSEEEEWFNFHSKNFYFNDENTNKEVLKRNLDTNQKNKNIDLTIYSKHRPHATKYSNKPTKINEEFTNKNKNTLKTLDYLDFTTRIVNKEDIPSYVDLLTDKKKKPICKNNPTHNSYKIPDIETTYAPSKVINYSVAPLYEGLNDSSDEESYASKLYVREGDLNVVYSSPFVTEYI